MKRINFIKRFSSIYICLYIGLIALTLTSCENFLNGSLLKDELEKNIAYSNAPSHKVRVIVENEATGVMVSGGGDNMLKVSDSLEISFKKKAGYNFVRWEAVAMESYESRKDYVEFKNETELTTIVTLIKDCDDIIIRPVCEEAIYFISKIPEYNENGVPRDTSIILTFSSPLSEENDLSRITVDISGSNVKGINHFKNPELFENQLLIVADLENRIDIPAGETRKITVTIPGDFVYNGEHQQFLIGEDMIHTYIINSSTNDKTFITYGTADENAGTFKVNGIAASAVSQQYSIGESVTVSYKTKDGYKFKGWENSNPDSIKVRYPEGTADVFGYNESTKTATATLQIVNSVKNATFNAVAEEIPFISISFDPAPGTGNVSPSSKNKYILDTGEKLTFTETGDYQFVEWIVVNKENGNNVTSENYIQIDNVYDMYTNFRFVKKPEEIPSLSIVPVCERRPKVVSATPLYDSDGVYRDRRLVVMFDQKFDENSIYYSSSERAKIENNNSNVVWLKKGDDINKAYGYKLDTGINSDNTIVYKALRITKLSDTSENLLKYYEAPEFDLNNTGVLRLSAKSGADLPPMATDILVTVTKDIGRVITDSNGNKKTINLASEYSWTYFTNSKWDNEQPEFVELSVKMKYAPPGQEALEKTDLSQISKDAAGISTLCKFNVPYGKNNPLDEAEPSLGILTIKGKIKDGGSGPKGLSAKIYKVNDPLWPGASEEHVLSYTASLEIIGQNGEIKTRNGDQDKDEEDLDISSLDEGMYKIIFTATDKNEITTTSAPYYFVWDHKGPVTPVTVNTSSCLRNSVTNEKIAWSSDYSDYKKVRIERYKADADGSIIGDVLESKVVEGNDYNFTLASNSNGQKFAYKIYSIDYVGNESEVCANYVDNDPPAKVSNFFGSRTSYGSENVNWTNPSDRDLDHLVVERYEVNNQNWTIRTTKDVKKSSTTTSFDSLTNQTKYGYRIYSVDFAGNKSEDYLSYVDNSAPALPAWVNSYTRNSSKVGIKIKTGSSNDIAKIKIILKSDNSEKASYDEGHNAVIDTELSTLTNTPGAEPTYIIRTFDYAGNYSDYEITERAGVAVGMYLYDDMTCSRNIYSNKNVIGVVCQVPNYTNVRIWDIYENQDYYWGANDGERVSCDHCNDSKHNYDGLWFLKEKAYPFGLHSKSLEKGSGSSIYKYIYEKNDSKTDTEVTSSKVIWYVPEITDYGIIYDNYPELKKAFDNLKKYSAYSNASLLRLKAPYHNATPAYYNNRCHIVAFNTGDDTELNKNIISRVGDWAINGDVDWQYKNYKKGDLTSLWWTSHQRENNNFRYTMKLWLHPMGQINLN